MHIYGIVFIIASIAIMYNSKESYGWYLFFFFAGIVIILAAEYKRKERIRYLNEYNHALSIKDAPSALHWGRLYYASLRDDGKLTIYDEQAITNDINAHCG